MDGDAVQRLIDRADIVQTMSEYAMSLDTRDWERLRTLLADELSLDFKALSGQPPTSMTADEFVAFAKDGIGGLSATQHLSTNHVVAVAGDEASAQSYIHAHHFFPNDRGSEKFTLYGIYDWGFVRSDGRWKITSYKLSTTWSEGNPQVLELALRPASHHPPEPPARR